MRILKIKNQQHQQGIVMIMLLLLLQMISLISLYTLKSTLLQTKLSQAFWFDHRDELWMKQALHLAEEDLLANNTTCFTDNLSTVEILSKSLDWWQSIESCTGNLQAFQYYYRVEFLQHDPCAVIDEGESQLTASYFRITLLGISDTKKILQSVVIKPNSEKTPLECNHLSHNVSAGRQMWRKLR